MSRNCRKIKIKRTFLGEDIKKKEIKLGPLRGASKLPPPGIKKWGGQKRPITSYKMKIKKKFSREMLKRKRSNWYPEGVQASSPSGGSKNLGVKKGRLPASK